MISHGKIFDIEIATAIRANGKYVIRVAASPRAKAVLAALEIAYRPISSAEDSGQAWLEIEYSAEIDGALRDLVDIAAGIRFSRPNFGQLTLTGLE